MRLIVVAGGLDVDRDTTWAVLEKLSTTPRFLLCRLHTHLMTGEALGAGRWAVEWAKTQRVTVMHVRHDRMLVHHSKATQTAKGGGIVIAFPGAPFEAFEAEGIPTIAWTHILKGSTSSGPSMVSTMDHAIQGVREVMS
ncbi:MAG: hypothetical protein AAGK98_18720 [Pseudomonadota bacterium]